jgi:zinc protease
MNHRDATTRRSFSFKNKTSVSLRLCGFVFSFLSLCGSARAQTRWPSESPPRPLAARDVKFPPYSLQTLPNGLQVVAVLHHEQPAISMRLLIRAGGSSDPKGKLGLAHLAANLLDQGTASKSAQDIADAIDFIGGALSTSAGTDLSQMSMIVMKDSFDSGMRMLSDITRHPAFAQEEIDRQKQQMLSSLRVSLEDPDYIANAVFDRLVYGFHPYGLPQSGIPETIATIGREDLLAFHRKYFAPNNAILAIVGDVTADEAFDEAKKVFGDWEKRDVAAEAFIDPPDPTRRVVVVNKPDAVQTEVRVGHLGVPRNSPDYMALNLAIRILGGEGSNRLHQVLRTERGLTYGAQASFDTLKRAGDVEAQTNTRSEATGEVLRLIVDEFWRLQRERVSERELADAKAYLTGSFPLTIETPDAIALQVLNVLFYDLPVDQLQTFRERVNAVTVDDIQRVARAYLKPDRLSVVLVGNAAAFSSQLKGVGFGTFETVDLGNLDLTAVDFKRGRTAAGQEARSDTSSDTGSDTRSDTSSDTRSDPSSDTDSDTVSDIDADTSRPPQTSQTPSTAQTPPTAISPEEGAKAKALLDRVVAAKGGLERLRTLKTITVATSTTTPSPAGTEVEVRAVTRIEYPNRVRIETTFPNGEQVQVFDGERAWTRDPKGVHDVPPKVVEGLKLGLSRDIVTLLVGAENGAVRARVLPDVKDESGTLYQALELTSASLDPLVLLVAPDTGLIARQTYVAGGPGQAIIEERYSDYRPVGGFQVPFTTKVIVGGKPYLERHVTDITFNVPIDSALFQRPR